MLLQLIATIIFAGHISFKSMKIMPYPNYIKVDENNARSHEYKIHRPTLTLQI